MTPHDTNDRFDAVSGDLPDAGAPGDECECPDATQALRALILDLEGFLESGDRLLRRARERLQFIEVDPDAH